MEVAHTSATQMIYTLDGSDPTTSASPLSASLPATILIDPEDTTNRYLAPGVVLRAMPVDDAPDPTKVSTQTYLFVSQVVALSPDGGWPGGGLAPAGTPGSTGFGDSPTNGQWIDYGMDPDVVNNAAYSDQIVPALLSIPSLSLVTDLANLFDPAIGIFVNADMKGEDPDPSGAPEAWERPGSVEIIYPDGTTAGVQTSAGIRIRGGYSRNDSNPKHAFKVYFRGIYGVDKVHYSFFGAEGADEFDRLDFRTSGNYSWSFDGDSAMRAKNTMNRDVFSRDLQRELGQPYTRSRYYHLYLDGVYWGLFQSQERAEAAYANTYFGGEKEEYDVIKSNKVNDREVEIEIADGTEETWMEVWNRAEAGFEADED